MLEFAAVGLGGFIGACLRFALAKALPAFQFPLATLLANVAAGFVIGIIVGLDSRLGIPPKTKLFLTTGMMGGLSTFSTFSLETLKLAQNGKMFVAGSNVVLNVALSVLGVALGLAVVKNCTQ